MGSNIFSKFVYQQMCQQVHGQVSEKSARKKMAFKSTGRVATTPRLVARRLNPAEYFELHYLLTSVRDSSPIFVKPVRFTNKLLSVCFLCWQIVCWNSVLLVERIIKSMPTFKSALCNSDLSAFHMQMLYVNLFLSFWCPCCIVFSQLFLTQIVHLWPTVVVHLYHLVWQL